MNPSHRIAWWNLICMIECYVNKLSEGQIQCASLLSVFTLYLFIFLPLSISLSSSLSPSQSIFPLSSSSVPEYIQKYATEEALKEQEEGHSSSESSMSDFSEDEAQDMEL